MEHTVSTTKESLLLAAGELFAEHGVEGTTVRAITEKCKANIAAVNYHFGSKESLYMVVIRHVLEQTRCYRAEELIRRRQDWAEDPLKCAEALYRIVEEHVQQFFTGIHPRWYGRLFMHILLQPTPAIWDIMEELAMPNIDALRSVLQCCCPNINMEETDLWVDSLMGQLIHYVYAEDFMRIIPNHKDLTDSGFQKAVLRHVAKVLIRGLNLPMPIFLQEGDVHA